MNRRFKLFKRAVETKDQNIRADYRRLRNEITSDLRKAKAAYFRDQLKKANTTSAYWNVLSKATNPKVRKKIGPLKQCTCTRSPAAKISRAKISLKPMQNRCLKKKKNQRQ